MCAVDDADYVTLWNVTRPVAAKEHRCYDCDRTIAVGERYHRGKSLFEGRWSSYAVCAHCEAAAGWLGRMCNGWLYGGIGEELGDHWAEGYRNVALGRLIILHQRDWQGVTPEQVAAWADESVDRITQKVAA
jgi:hypothetical protein